MTRLVRVTPENLVYCVQLGSELVALSHYPALGVEFDWNHTMSRLYDTCHRPDYYMCMSQHGDEFTGVVGGHVSCHVFSPQVMGLEDVWFVRPKSPERTKTAVALMRSFVEWCRGHGATMVQAADSASIAPLAVDRLYRHMGFERFGSTYNYRVEARDVDTRRAA